MKFEMRSFGVSINANVSLNVQDIIEQRITDQLVREALAEIVLLNTTTHTWQTFVPPRFTYEVFHAGGNIDVEISTDDKIWNYLNGGTEAKYIRGTWSNKTHVGVLESGYGYRQVVWSKKFSPLDGIEARQWYRQVIKERRGKYNYNLDRLISRLSKYAIFGGEFGTSGWS